MTDIRGVPAIPRPDMFIDTEGKITPPGYAYLDEMARVLGEVRSLLSTVEGASEANTASIQSLIDNPPPTTLLRKRTNVVMIEGGSPIGPSASLEIVLSQQYSCVKADGRVFAIGNAGHSHGTGGNDNNGFVALLYVDGEYTGRGVLDWASTDAVVINTPFSLEYEPGDTEPHLYEIRCSSTVSAIYGYSNWMHLEELAPNPE